MISSGSSYFGGWWGTLRGGCRRVLRRRRSWMTGGYGLRRACVGRTICRWADAKVEVHVIGPEGMAATVTMIPAGDVPGNFVADWTAEKSGAYLAEITAEANGSTARAGAGNGDSSKDIGGM